MTSSLASLCREHLLREKILVVPSLAIGHQIADAIAHGGTSWINLRVETVRTLADGVAGFVIAREGLVTLSRAQALALIEEACDEALDSFSYFAALKDRPGLHRAVQRSIDDLRHAGVDPSALASAAFDDQRKAQDLRAILAAYQQKLTRGPYVDRFGVLARAIALLESGARYPSASDALWLAVDDLELTSAETHFLELVSGGAPQAVAASEEERAAFPQITFVSAAGEENEVRGALRAILSANRPFDDAEIVYTTRDPYLPLTFELASEYDVPCTFAEGIPAHFTRPGQAVLGFLRWFGGRWDARELQSIARSGTLKLEGISPASFARVLRKAAIGWGRERYRLRFDGEIERLTGKLATDDPSRLEANQRAVDDITAASAAIDALLAVSADVAEGEEIDPADASRVAARFTGLFAATRNEIDGMASAGLQRMLEELAAIPGRRVPRGEVTARLEEAVRNLHVAASNPKPGFLHAAPARAGGWSARHQLFIVGADDARHPGRGLEDPIVLDSERAAINRTLRPGQLLLASEAPLRASEQFRRLLDRSSRRAIHISYPSVQLSDRREHFPSAGFLDLYRRATGRPDATYAEVDDAVTKETFVDPRPLSGTEWWLHQRFEGSGSELRAPLLAAYPMLAAGAAATTARDSDEITAWDGRIVAPPAELDPRRNGKVYSASQLMTMASCPYGYFLQKVLRLEVADELLFNPDVWLDPRQFGTLLHKVLEVAMTGLRAAKKKPTLAFLDRLKEIAQEALTEQRRIVPPPGEQAFERQRLELLDACEVFLQVEEKTGRHVTPKYFEVSFGFGETDGIALPEPLVIPLGRGKSLALRGRIDRVDVHDVSGGWSVWDYKSGRSTDFDGGGRLQCGTTVQYAIYSRALEAMLARKGLGGKVVQSGYYFPTTKGRGVRVARECAAGELEHALNALFDVIGTGYFPHAAKEACRWCDFKDVCGGAELAAKRTEVKLAAHAKDRAVAAWQRLQEVE